MLKKLILLSTLTVTGLAQAGQSVQRSFNAKNHSDIEVVVSLKTNHPDLLVDQQTITLQPKSEQEIAFTIKKNLICANHPLYSRLKPSFNITCSCIIDGKEQVKNGVCTTNIYDANIYVDQDNTLQLLSRFIQ